MLVHDSFIYFQNHLFFGYKTSYNNIYALTFLDNRIKCSHHLFHVQVGITIHYRCLGVMRQRLYTLLSRRVEVFDGKKVSRKGSKHLGVDSVFNGRSKYLKTSMDFHVSFRKSNLVFQGFCEKIGFESLIQKRLWQRKDAPSPWLSNVENRRSLSCSYENLFQKQSHARTFWIGYTFDSLFTSIRRTLDIT